MRKKDLVRKVNSLNLSRREKKDLIEFILPVCDDEFTKPLEDPVGENCDKCDQGDMGEAGIPEGYEIKEIDDVFKIYKDDGTRSVKNCESYEEAFCYIKELEG